MLLLIVVVGESLQKLDKGRLVISYAASLHLGGTRVARYCASVQKSVGCVGSRQEGV